MGLILVVDDDVDMIELTKKYLSSEGYEIIAVTNPFDAEEVLEKYRINLALVDINMPQRNGFDFVGQMKRSLRNRFVPIVFVSGRNEKKDIERALKLDIEGYLVKPFKKEDLVNKVKSVLANTKSDQTSIAKIDVSSKRIVGSLSLKYQVHVLEISEIGLLLASDVSIGEVNKDLENTVEVLAPIWALISIAPVPLKVVNQSIGKDGKTHIYSCLFKTSIPPEDLEKLRHWIKKSGA